jgi:hypothetical protein
MLQIPLPDGSSALSKVQYLSSTSGGSWFNAAFSYKVRKSAADLPNTCSGISRAVDSRCIKRVSIACLTALVCVPVLCVTLAVLRAPVDKQQLPLADSPA